MDTNKSRAKRKALRLAREGHQSMPVAKPRTPDVARMAADFPDRFYLDDIPHQPHHTLVIDRQTGNKVEIPKATYKTVGLVMRTFWGHDRGDAHAETRESSPVAPRVSPANGHAPHTAEAPKHLRANRRMSREERAAHEERMKEVRRNRVREKREQQRRERLQAGHASEPKKRGRPPLSAPKLPMDISESGIPQGWDYRIEGENHVLEFERDPQTNLPGYRVLVGQREVARLTREFERAFRLHYHNGEHKDTKHAVIAGAVARIDAYHEQESY